MEKNTSKFNERFIKDYNKESDKGYILEVDNEYPKGLYNLHNDLPFLLEKSKIKNRHKLVCNLNDKRNYNAHIRSLKQALNHELLLKKVHRVIQSN